MEHRCDSQTKTDVDDVKILKKNLLKYVPIKTKIMLIPNL